MMPSEIDYFKLCKIIRDIASSRHWFSDNIGLTNYIGFESNVGLITYLNTTIQYAYVRIGIIESKKYNETKSLDWNIDAMMEVIRYKLIQINQYNNFKGAVIVFGSRQAGIKHELKKYYL